ncbi:MAG: hypothetical protein HY040_13620 [Planctomycetes bacterium]|nr:hypothetical protein [Planctomycetota bacterium]
MIASDHQIIKEGLKFLTKADRRAIRAADELWKLTGTANPPTPADLLDRFDFSVAGHPYHGKMTAEQYNYLAAFQATQKKFADAVAWVLLNLNGAVVHALSDLIRGLKASATLSTASGRKAVAVVIPPPPPVGCCRYDTNQQSNGVTRTFCELGLQGNWDSHPCPPPFRRPGRHHRRR